MKRFKDILNKFRANNKPPTNNEPPIDHSGRGGEDPVDQVIEFMKSVPFIHKTADDNVFVFWNSHDAASRILENKEKHDRGWRYAMTNGSSIRPTVLRQRISILGSHNSAMRELHTHILQQLSYAESRNSRKIPKIDAKSSWREHVSKVFERLENEAINKVDSLHAHLSIGDHPHQDDTAHHFQTIIQHMRENPDIGQFIHKSEYDPDIGFHIYRYKK